MQLKTITGSDPINLEKKVNTFLLEEIKDKEGNKLFRHI